VVFAIFRLAAIAQGIMGRVIGRDRQRSPGPMRGERAKPLADAGWIDRAGMKR